MTVTGEIKGNFYRKLSDSDLYLLHFNCFLQQNRKFSKSTKCIVDLDHLDSIGVSFWLGHRLYFTNDQRKTLLTAIVVKSEQKYLPILAKFLSNSKIHFVLCS
jgi:hypothetical protein